MALQKRLDYGFNGCQVPFIPRRSRSARVRRGTFRKKVEDRQMCAFELLATVAGKLLAEKESSSGNSKKSSSGSNDASDGKSEIAIVKDTVKQERQEVDKFVKVEKHENGFDETVLGSQLGLQGKKRIYNSKEFSDADVGIGQLSGVDNAGRSDEFGCAKWKTVKNKNEVRKFPEDESHSPGYGQTREVKVVDRIGRQKKVDSMINGSVQNMCSSEDLMELDTKPPALIGSDSSINVPISETHTPRVSFSEFSDDNKVVNTDDDENSSGCTKLSTINMKSFRSYKHIGGRRTGKLMASKYWKVAPKLKDGQRSKTDMKLIFHNSKNVTRQRSQGNSPFKKRKLFRQSSVLAFEGGTTDEGVSGSSEKDIVGDTSSAGSGESSTVSGKEALFQARDSHVKLHIKSFKIPELCIDVPETATVGSLKRTVMEAVTAILGGGLRVGMVLKGKTVRDDNKTLAQTGISHEDQLANIGFTLEPNPAHTLQANHREDSSYLVPDTPQPLTRYLTTPTSDTRVSNTSLYPRKRNLGNFVESDHDAVLSPTETSADKTTQNSRALVSMPTVRMDALAVVPLQRKSRQADLVQRRIRRPFSVSEVEALVQAVEKLGTGRWRDVKNRAFDDAEHRTYVDLKDKWKTLVHTAQISPQQRRGEPVPQELLDRVLRAHGHWSQQQAKQQVKNETCLLL